MILKFSVGEWVDKIIDWATTKGLALIIGLVVLFISFKLINLISKKIYNRVINKAVDKTVSLVIYKTIKIVLKLLMFVLFLGYVGIETAGIGAAIASLGVAIGLALQGSLSNLAGGIIILIMRPFKIGDFIVAQDQSGTVEEIKMFYTYLRTTDNRVVMIPNGTLANGVIINNSKKDIRRVDLRFSISYLSNYQKAKEIIEQLITEHPLTLKEPAFMVRMSEHGSSAIIITVLIWVKSENYWNVYYDMLENVKEKFDQEKIEIPYPQIDVHNR